MKSIVAIVAAALVNVAALLGMSKMGDSLPSDSHVRNAIAGALAGLVAIVLARKKKEK